MKKQSIILISTLLFALILCGSASATSGLDNVYVATDGNDSWDGSQATPGPGGVGPKQSIEAGITLVNTNGTINLAAGTYNKTDSGHSDINLGISRNMNIIGAGTGSTIIDAMGLSNIFNIATSTVTIKDLTLKNGENDFGGAIDCAGTLILENVLFENNHATLSGGAIRSRDSLYVDGCQFISNYAGSGLLGGAIFAQGQDATIKNSQFIGNHAEKDGGAIWALIVPLTIENCIFTGNYVTDEIGKGGAIYTVYNKLNVTKSTFSSNTADQGGAIFIVGTDFLIKGNNFLNNEGSAIYIQMGPSGSTPTQTYRNINFNRFYGNTEYAIYLYSGNEPVNDGVILDGAAFSDEIPFYLIDATNNWWGSNSNPKDNPNNIGGDAELVDADPWLTLTINSNPTNVAFGGTSTITASLNINSDGVDISSQGYVPDGTMVTITTDIGNVGSKQVTVPTVAGIATAILRANEGYGLANLYAILDGFRTPLPANVVIAQAASTSTVNANTVGMQTTGAPIAGMALAILMVIGGLFTARRK